MSEAGAFNLIASSDEIRQTKDLLKAYPVMKGCIEIYTDQCGDSELNEFDLANAEGRGTRGDIDGRGKIGDVVGNTAILREERPQMIVEYEMKLKAIDKALQALPPNQRDIITKRYLEQTKDKDIYEFVLNWPKSTYDFHKKQALSTLAYIFKTTQII